MRILITGASGFLGSHLARALKAQDHEVFNFSRRDYPEVKTLKGDLCNKASVLEAFKGMDAVFHVASQVGMWGPYKKFYETNVIGTQNVIEACLHNGIQKLIYTSSPSVVFGSEDLCHVDESTPYPKKYYSSYGKTKALAEQAVLRANGLELATVALRPHLIFGYEDPHLFPRIIEMAKKGRLRRVGEGTNLVDVIHVDNAVHAHLLALEKLSLGSKISGQAYFLAQEKPVKLWDFVDEILRLHHISPLKKTLSFKKAFILGALCEGLCRILPFEPPMTRFVALQFSRSHYFNHQKAKEELGYSPLILLPEALEKSVRLDHASS